MPFSRGKFLIDVLGRDRALALAKAADRSEDLAKVIVPRTILAWLEAVPHYDGVVPGLEGTELRFQKSESGFTGSVKLQDREHEFQDATIFHVAGAVATAMDLEFMDVGSLRNAELQKLGKTIDLMAKVQLAKSLMGDVDKAVASKRRKEESSPEDVTGEYSRQEVYQKDEKPASGKCKECGGTKGKHYDRLVAGLFLKCKNDPTKPKQMEKKALGEGSGKTAGPIAPEAPAAPTATAPQHTTDQNLPKPPGTNQGAKPITAVKLTRSETSKHCPFCAQLQFDGSRFVGCLCFRALNKSVKTLWHSDASVTLQLGEGWDRETVVTFYESVGRK